jgi:hypothetical protein
MDIDSSGNIYIVGASWDPDAEHTRWVTLKYDSSGNLLWSTLYPEAGGGGILNAAYSVATDQSGNVYVFGLEASFNQFTGHYLLIKYNSSGNQVWTRAGTTNSYGNNAIKVVTDQSGSIYITARYGSDINTLKYNSSGTLQWSMVYDASGNDDMPTDLCVDNNGNVYVTGTSLLSSAPGSEDYVTIKYNSAGNQQWAKLYNGPGNDYDGANALTVDSDGNVFVTGISNESGSIYDYATIKYSSSGNEIWVNRYNGSGNIINFGTAVKTDQNGYVYILGGTGSAEHLNFGFLALNPDAVQQWSAEYNANGDSLYTHPLLSLGNDGSFYVAGSTFESGIDYRFALIKYIAVVPVELTSFTASSTNNEVLLNWSTATELNNRGFEIQRSTEGLEFLTVGFVKGHGTTTEQQNYSYADRNLNDGKYFFRLKQVDYDGSYEYSDIVDVELRAFNSYLLEQNWPNPFNPTTTIGFGVQNKSNVKITVLNAIGEEVAVLLNEEREPGYHQVEFRAVNLPSGVYFYRIQAGEFVSTKKMILLK